jgi:hypothetical protein
MKTNLRPSILFLCLLVVTGCFSGKKKLNERPSLWYKDKVPYGTWFAYNSLIKLYGDSTPVLIRDYSIEADAFNQAYADTVVSKYFDSVGADIAVDSVGAVAASEVDKVDEEYTGDDDYEDPTRQLYVVVGFRFYPSQEEIAHLLNYVSYGNHLLVSSLSMNTPFLEKMGLRLEAEFFDSSEGDTVIYRQRPDTLQAYQEYGYPGFNIKQYFAISDSTKNWTVLGTTESGKANCIRIQHGWGTITLQCNPYLLSNFFLLHKENNSLWTSMLDGISGPFSIIWWDTYFRKRKDTPKGFSALGVLMQFPSLKWALYTALILLGVILVSEVKRRQKAIPAIPPPENPSLDFVKTIGRLYYNTHDNVDLVRKMETQFWEFVRQHYSLPAGLSDSALARMLARKAGVEESLVKTILEEFRSVDEHGAVSDEDLIHINRLIEQFHKNRT